MTNCVASSQGGVMFLNSAKSLTIKNNSTFHTNKATTDGVVLYSLAEDLAVTISSSTFYDGTSYSGTTTQIDTILTVGTT